MVRQRVACLLLLSVALPLAGLPAQGSDQADRRAVRAVVDTVLEAMAQHDVATSRRLLTPGAILTSGRTGEIPTVARVQVDTAYLRMLGTDTSGLRERIWEPTIMVSGSVAQLWAPYDFHLNGVFSHCGVDSFSLVRAPGGWQVAAIVYDVRRSGCAPSPLGPLPTRAP